MDIEEIRDYCLSLPGVTEDMPFGDDNVVFRIGGKIFLCLWLGTEEPRFAIKLPPCRNEELRARYDGVTPGYHWNKKHWSDVYYEKGFTGAQLREWIGEAYRLVQSSLPKALRQ